MRLFARSTLYTHTRFELRDMLLTPVPSLCRDPSERCAVRGPYIQQCWADLQAYSIWVRRYLL